MSLEIRLNDRYAQVELVSRDENKVKIKVDDKIHEVDIVEVEDGVYSLLMNGRSYVVELMDGVTSKKYNAKTFYKSFDLEIIDAETRYLMSRKGNDIEDEGNQISSPMPGKIVKIPVKVGEKVVAGQSVIIVSAMKMESEYKAGHDGVIKEIHVKEGDTIEGNQLLISIE
ncbi:MAG TPA: acetyl-CoA carboxylase biotin carboxyl carrier protein subunit [Bacteroides sp.]|nr:acetyl-CoA carboxylase biotin carboxyl carrier protein subunit [Bacteroides sp.]